MCIRYMQVEMPPSGKWMNGFLASLIKLCERGGPMSTTEFEWVKSNGFPGIHENQCEHTKICTSQSMRNRGKCMEGCSLPGKCGGLCRCEPLYFSVFWHARAPCSEPAAWDSGWPASITSLQHIRDLWSGQQGKPADAAAYGSQRSHSLLQGFQQANTIVSRTWCSSDKWHFSVMNAVKWREMIPNKEMKHCYVD